MLATLEMRSHCSFRCTGHIVICHFDSANVASANTFNLSGWSGGGLLAGGGGNDILAMTKSNDFLITDFQAAASNGMSVSLNSIEIANLTGDAGTNRFNVEYWTGRGTFTGGGGADAVRVVKAANYELTNTRLQTDDGMDLTLAARMV